MSVSHPPRTTAYAIIGGAGFIGSSLCNRLIEQGDCDTIIVIDALRDKPASPYDATLKKRRLSWLKVSSSSKSFFEFAANFPSSESRPKKRALFYEVDCNNILELASIFVWHRVNTVFHLAAQPGVRNDGDPTASITDTLQSMISVTLAIDEAMVAGAPLQHLIFTSSSSVYGDTPVPPGGWTEQSPTHARDGGYASYKLRAETYLRTWMESKMITARAKQMGEGRVASERTGPSSSTNATLSGPSCATISIDFEPSVPSTIIHSDSSASSSAYTSFFTTASTSTTCTTCTTSTTSTSASTDTLSKLSPFRTSVVRLFSVYGPWGRPDMAPLKFLEAAYTGSTACFAHRKINYRDTSFQVSQASADILRDFTYIDDVVSALIAVAENTSNEDEKTNNDTNLSTNTDSTLLAQSADSADTYRVLNIGYSSPSSLYNLALCVASALGRPLAINITPAASADVPITHANISAALLCLKGWQPNVRLFEGMLTTAKWYTSLVSPVRVIALVATHNRPELLATRALASILAQTKLPDAVVIVDDSAASREQTSVQGVASSIFSNTPIRYHVLRNSRTPGASGAWNTGILYAAALAARQPSHGGLGGRWDQTFVAVLDDDDEWLPHHIQVCSEAARRSGAQMVVPGLIRIEDTYLPAIDQSSLFSSNIVSASTSTSTSMSTSASISTSISSSIPTSNWISRPQSIPDPESLVPSTFYTSNPHIQGSNMFVSISLFMRAGLFGESLRSTTDRDFMARVTALPAHESGIVSLRKDDVTSANTTTTNATRGSASDVCATDKFMFIDHHTDKIATFVTSTSTTKNNDDGGVDHSNEKRSDTTTTTAYTFSNTNEDGNIKKNDNHDIHNDHNTINNKSVYNNDDDNTNTTKNKNHNDTGAVHHNNHFTKALSPHTVRHYAESQRGDRLSIAGSPAKSAGLEAFLSQHGPAMTSTQRAAFLTRARNVFMCDPLAPIARSNEDWASVNDTASAASATTTPTISEFTSIVPVVVGVISSQNDGNTIRPLLQDLARLQREASNPPVQLFVLVLENGAGAYTTSDTTSPRLPSPLASAVQEESGNGGIMCSIITLDDISKDDASGYMSTCFGKGGEDGERDEAFANVRDIINNKSSSARLSISSARTLIQRYAYIVASGISGRTAPTSLQGLATSTQSQSLSQSSSTPSSSCSYTRAHPQEPVVWILDDDKSFDPLVADIYGHVSPVWSGGHIIGDALRVQAETGAAVVLGCDTEAPPLPMSSCLRLQLRDILGMLQAVAACDNLSTRLPECSSVRRHGACVTPYSLAKAGPDFYHDLSAVRSDHLEVPVCPVCIVHTRCWGLAKGTNHDHFIETPTAEDAVKLLVEFILPQVLQGAAVTRPLALLQQWKEGMKMTISDSVARGGCAFIFDAGALQDVPNTSPIMLDGRHTRRSDMIWAQLNTYAYARRSVLVREIAVRHRRVGGRITPGSRSNTHTLLDDIVGHAVYKAMGDILSSLEFRNERSKYPDGNSPITDATSFTSLLNRFEAVLQLQGEQRALAAQSSIGRMHGLLSSIKCLVHQPILVRPPRQLPGSSSISNLPSSAEATSSSSSAAASFSPSVATCILSRSSYAEAIEAFVDNCMSGFDVDTLWGPRSSVIDKTSIVANITDLQLLRDTNANLHHPNLRKWLARIIARHCFANTVQATRLFNSTKEREVNLWIRTVSDRLRAQAATILVSYSFPQGSHLSTAGVGSEGITLKVVTPAAQGASSNPTSGGNIHAGATNASTNTTPTSSSPPSTNKKATIAVKVLDFFRLRAPPGTLDTLVSLSASWSTSTGHNNADALKATNNALPPLSVSSLESRICLLQRPWIEGVHYHGGYGAALVVMLKHVRSKNVCCNNFSPENILVVHEANATDDTCRSGSQLSLALIDYGLDVEAYSHQRFRRMALRAYLCWRWAGVWTSTDLREALPRARAALEDLPLDVRLDEHKLPEAAGFSVFEDALNQTADSIEASFAAFMIDIVTRGYPVTGGLQPRCVLDFGCGKGAILRGVSTRLGQESNTDETARQSAGGSSFVGYDPDASLKARWESDNECRTAAKSGSTTMFSSSSTASSNTTVCPNLVFTCERAEVVDMARSTGGFDVVICSRVLCAVSDVQEAAQVLDDVAACVEPTKGIVYLAICHPAASHVRQTTLQLRSWSVSTRCGLAGSTIVTKVHGRHGSGTRLDCHRPLHIVFRMLRAAGLEPVQQLNGPFTVDLQSFERTSELLVLACRPVSSLSSFALAKALPSFAVQSPTSSSISCSSSTSSSSSSSISSCSSSSHCKTALMIKVCAMECDTLRELVRHQVESLEGPHVFDGGIHLVLDCKRQGFTRAYRETSLSALEKLERTAQQLRESGWVDAVIFERGDQNEDLTRNVSREWFGEEAALSNAGAATHSYQGAPHFSTLNAFSQIAASGVTLLLQVDSDIMIRRGPPAAISALRSAAFCTRGEGDGYVKKPYLPEVKQLFDRDPTALTLSLPVTCPFPYQVPFSCHNEEGIPWRVEVRGCFLHLPRLLAARPLPWKVREGGSSNSSGATRNSTCEWQLSSSTLHGSIPIPTNFTVKIGGDDDTSSSGVVHQELPMPWYRLVDEAIRTRPHQLRSYRGGLRGDDLLFIHPQNNLKVDLQSYGSMIDYVEHGGPLPLGQEGVIDAVGESASKFIEAAAKHSALVVKAIAKVPSRGGLSAPSVVPTTWIRTEEYIFVITGQKVAPSRMHQCLESICRQRVPKDVAWGVIVIWDGDGSDDNDALPSSTCEVYPASSIYASTSATSPSTSTSPFNTRSQPDPSWDDAKSYLRSIVEGGGSDACVRLHSRSTLLCPRFRRGKLSNTMFAIRTVCTDPSSVIILLDLDDELIGDRVLEAIDDAFAFHGVDVFAGGMLGTDKHRTDKDSKGVGAGTTYDVDFASPRVTRNAGNVRSHPCAARKHAFELIHGADLREPEMSSHGAWSTTSLGAGTDRRDNNRPYIESAADWAFMLPLVEMAWKIAQPTVPVYLYELYHQQQRRAFAEGRCAELRGTRLNLNPVYEGNDHNTSDGANETLKVREEAIDYIMAQQPYVARVPVVAVIGDASYSRTRAPAKGGAPGGAEGGGGRAEGTVDCRQLDPAFVAEHIGYELAAMGLHIICGGLGGAMEAAARGAQRALIDRERNGASAVTAGNKANTQTIVEKAGEKDPTKSISALTSKLVATATASLSPPVAIAIDARSSTVNAHGNQHQHHLQSLITLHISTRTDATSVTGILPDSQGIAGGANTFVDLALRTGIGKARNNIIATAADAVIVVGGGAGTMNEASAAWADGRLVIAMKGTGGTADKIAGTRFDERQRLHMKGAMRALPHAKDVVHSAESVEEAIQIINRYIHWHKLEALHRAVR